MADVTNIEEAVTAVDQIVRTVSLVGESLQEYRLKLQNAKAAIEALENDLADMEDREVNSFTDLEADRLVNPKVIEGEG